MADELSTQTFWKKCSSCKKDIPFSAMYYLCSVSTCKHKRTGFRFCSVPCWDAHLGFARHRESWAEEARSPSREQYLAEVAAEQGATPGGLDRSPVKKIVEAQPPRPSEVTSSGTAVGASKAMPVETLIVVSKVKAFIKENSDFNVSQCCVDALTQKVVDECLKGIEHAKGAGRKTVMGRDIR